ncbi:hypothetical protein F2P56_006483 [Juglans regia]|uniref:Uncharacterized protein n=1 Tax=Juglans regia TaxID=51240 RepID=A0A834D207_JUGRE|nr:hypothetical protein F2P56_006483 [Juglans regia]
MAQIMCLLWWPKNTATTKSGGGSAGSTTASATSMSTTAVSSTCLATDVSPSHCCCLTKLVRKLKRHSRGLRATSSRQSSFQCRYDPLSYSLNFDTTGSGGLLDEDYHQFCSFSSRFVANPRNPSPRLVLATASH